MDELIVKHISNPITKEVEHVAFTIEGQTLSNVIDAIVPKNIKFRVLYNSIQITEENVKLLASIVRPTDDIYVIPHVGGDDVGRIVGIIGIAVLSYATAGAVGAAYGVGWGALAGAAINIAGGILLNHLFGPDVPSALETPGKTYSWTPKLTQLQGVALSSYYGTLRAKSGNIINSFRVDREGVNTDSISAMVSYGYGPIKAVRDVKVNDQYETEDDSLEIHRRLGYLTQKVVKGFESSIVDSNPGFDLSEPAGFFTYDIIAGADKISFTLSFTNGLFEINGKGEKAAATAEFNVYLEDQTTLNKFYFHAGDTVGSPIGPTVQWVFGEWVIDPITGIQTIFSNLPDTQTWENIFDWINYDESTADSLTQAQTEYKDPAHPNAYWRRIEETGGSFITDTGQSVSLKLKILEGFDLTYSTLVDSTHEHKLYIERTSEPPEDGVSLTYLNSVKQFSNEVYTYPRNVLLAINAAPSERFYGGLNIEPLIDGKLIRVYNGSTWATEFSKNVAWVAYDIATQPVLDDTTLLPLRYNGIDPSRVNTNDFYDWAQLCDDSVPDGDGGTETRFEFNGVFEGGESVWAALLRLGSLYRGTPYWNGTELRVTVDRAVSVATQLFTEGNILQSSFKESYVSWEDRATELDLRYLDQNREYESTQISITDIDLTQERNKIDITAFGTTSQSQAWRIGKFLLAKNKYTNKIISFDVDVDTIDALLGDVIELQHNLPNWGEGGRITSAAGTTIYVQGILRDSVYLEMGISQGTIDAWHTGGADYVTTAQVDTGITLHVRAKDNTYSQYAIYDGGYRNGMTEFTLQSTDSFDVLPVKDDLFASSMITYGESQMFKIIDLALQNDTTVKISAAEYNILSYSEADGVPIIDQTVYNIPDKFPLVSNIVASSRLYLDDDNNYIRDLNVSWTLPSDLTYFSKANVYYQLGASNTEFGPSISAGTSSINNLQIPAIGLANYYKITITTINSLGIESTKGISTSYVYAVSDTTDTDIPTMSNGVTNLRVGNSIGDNLTFTDSDCIITWDAPSGDFEVLNWLQTYVIEIHDSITDELYLSEQVGKDNLFTITFDINKGLKDGPHRTFDVVIYAIDTLGVAGLATVITPANNQAGQVTGLAAKPSFGQVELSWDYLTEQIGTTTSSTRVSSTGATRVTSSGATRREVTVTDESRPGIVTGYEIHISTSSGFTPGVGTLYATVRANVNTISVTLDDGIYYFKVGAFDAFDFDGITYSVQETFTIDSGDQVSNLLDFAEEISGVYKVPVIQGDTWNTDGTNLSWNEHALWYDGIEYTISAGATTGGNAYVYWSGLSSSYTHTSNQTTFDNLDNESNEWQIAINFGTGFELAWNAQANTVIGTARIGYAAVQNANIGNIIQSASYAYTPGVSASGWRLDKEGNIIAQSITIVDSNGDIILSAGSVTWSAVSGTGVPDDNADVSEDALETGVAITTGGIIMSSTATIHTLNKDSATDTTPGFFIGPNTFGIGSGSTSRLYWNGTTLEIRGTLNADDINAGNLAAARIATTDLNADNLVAGTVTGRTLQTASSGQRFVVNSTNNRADFYNSSGTKKISIGEIAAAVGGNANILIENADTTYQGLVIDKGGWYGAKVYSARTGAGHATSNIAIYAEAGGTAPFSIGLWGVGNSLGIYGTTTAGKGVKGLATTGIGVEGESTSGYGMYGHSSSDVGIYGLSTSLAGIEGKGLHGGRFVTPSSTAGGQLVLDVTDKTSSNPGHTAEIGTIYVNTLGEIFINRNGSTGWWQFSLTEL